MKDPMQPPLARLVTSMSGVAPRLLAAAAAIVLAGCAAGARAPASAQYDFGASNPPAAMAASGNGAAMAALVLTDVTGNAAFDNERMYYRLNYADPLQARSYANSRWGSTPLQLLTQRLRSRVAQAGIKVLSASDASTGVPLLRVDLDDFTHGFDSAASSYGQVVLRASLFQGHTLLDQRTFSGKVGAASADAAGGARALAQASDAVAAAMITWLGEQQMKLAQAPQTPPPQRHP